MNTSRPLHELRVVCLDDLRHAVTGPLMLFLMSCYVLLNLLVTLLYTALSGTIVSKISESEGAGKAALVVQGTPIMLSQGLAKIFSEWTGSPAEGGAIAAIPLPALYLFFVAALFVPLISVLSCADLVADDLRTKHVRYLAMRCGRLTLLGGRMIARWCLLAVTMLIGVLASYALFTAKLDSLPPGTLLHFLRFAGMLAAMCFTFVGLAALGSTLVRHSFLALVLSLFGVLLLLVIWAIDRIEWASPLHYWRWLFSPNLQSWPLGVLAFVGFGLLFGALAGLRLRTRDL